jgi:hypothetical protein
VPTRPEPWLRRFSAIALGSTLVVLTAVGAAGCGADEVREPKVIEYVVPLGTSERIARGEIVEIMPERIEMRLGDTLRLRNDDHVAQEIGPYVLQPGKSLDLRYGAVGTYWLECLLAGGSRFEIAVTK